MRLSLVKFVIPMVALSLQCFSQTGITAAPAKLFYYLPPGAVGVQNVTISNPLSRELEVGVSLGDWKYDSTGVNSLLDPGTIKTSCANWIKILPGSYFTLFPNERKELNIEVTVPDTVDQDIPVHTAMLYFTQLNPSESKTKNGASIKVSVRMGIKVYHGFSQTAERDIEISDFFDKKDEKNASSPGFLELKVENTGKLWIDGKVKWELLNSKTGDKVKMNDSEFLMLPGDKRTLSKELPKDLKKGSYSVTSIINYGSKDELKIAELEFEY